MKPIISGQVTNFMEPAEEKLGRAISVELASNENCEFVLFVWKEEWDEYQALLNAEMPSLGDEDYYEIYVPLTTNIDELLEIHRGFRKFYYFSPKTGHLHHKQQLMVERILTAAYEQVRAMDYEGLWRVIKQEYSTASEPVQDAIADIWDAAATCLFYLGVNVYPLYNLAEI